MKVLLRENIKGVGKRGEVVEVKDGFARNMLLPTNKALIANRKIEIQAEQMRKAESTRVQKAAEQVQRTFDTLHNSTITVNAKAGENEKLFGSVTINDIVEAILQQLSIEVDRRNVQEVEHIKTLGDHKVLIKLDASLTAELNVKVLPN
jgi:large subunit ribosomal protein L9